MSDSLPISAALREMTRIEFARMMLEAKEKQPKLDQDLEDLRQKLIPEMLELERLTLSHESRRPEKRVQLSTVAEILDVPVNELVLHFLNGARLKNERSLVEYRLGHVYFYAG